MTIKEWKAEIAELKAKEKASTITKEEADKLDFMEQKLDDWISDYEVRE